jgi:hypothetical protein
MNTSQQFQKISTGVSLATLALGFCLIGLMSLIHPALSGDSIASTVMSCEIGGWASMATAGAFLFAAWIYWRRYFALSSHSFAQLENPGSRPDGKNSYQTAFKKSYVPSGRESIALGA